MTLDPLGFEKPPDNVRWHAPAAERNRAPILDVLRKVMPVPGTILEVAAGSGQHGAWFAPEFPNHCWAPSDIQPEALGSIDAWCRNAGGTILPARLLDAAKPTWPVDDIANDLVAIYNVNMIHITMVRMPRHVGSSGKTSTAVWNSIFVWSFSAGRQGGDG